MRWGLKASCAAIAAAALFQTAGCWVQPWDPNIAYVCDAGHDCIDGFSCIGGRCLDCDGGNPACVTQCAAAPYLGCGNTECSTNPCLLDGGCTPRVPLTGTVCSAGVCRNDGTCVSSGTEYDCTNGSDEDGDTLIDCADPDCLGIGCNNPDKCVVAVCQANGSCGGAPTTCTSRPGACFQTVGTCVPATGLCSYPVDLADSCSDSNLCTTVDYCLSDGGCGGNATTCTTPPGACYSTLGTCNPSDGGCMYPVNLAAACSDGNDCTVDACQPNGTCSGTPYSCPSPTECQVSNVCTGDGGCSATGKADGTPCTGGVCRTGSCFTFAYSPSNFSATTVANGGIGGDVVINCNAVWNTTSQTYASCGGPTPTPSLVTQSGGIQAAVLAMRSLTINAGQTLTIYGSRPAILAAWGNAAINGTLSVRSILGADAGAGGNVAGCAGGDGEQDLGCRCGGGGGGGGFGGPGGDGGEAYDPFPNLLGGAGSGVQGSVSLVPLRGGCRGGSGGRGYDPSATGSYGGSGGGAVQVSAAGTLSVTGIVTASGAGGMEGHTHQSASSNGGGGGGSGGAILLEGQAVDLVSAALTANGGGGAEASDGSGDGDHGDDGRVDAGTQAPGGTFFTIGGNGGLGGALNGAAATGQTAQYAGGGGGGAVGRIRVNSQGTCTVSGGVRSPQARGDGAHCSDPIP